MEKSNKNNKNEEEIYDKSNGLYYTKKGDYYYPNITLDNNENIKLGKYGRARLRYLKEYKRGTYAELIMTGKLMENLKEIDEISNKRIDNIISEMAKKDDIPVYFNDEKIDQLEWVKYMNNYKNIAEEIVYNELIYC